MSSSYHDVIKAHLDCYQLSFRERQGRFHTYFEVSYPTPTTMLRIVLDQHEDDGLVIAYFNLPVLTPEAKRNEVVRFLNWLNYNRAAVGNFEMDIRDGEIRYRNNMDIEGSELSDCMVYNLLAQGISRITEFCPDILAVCFGDRTADDMIARRLDGEDHEEEPTPDFVIATPSVTH